MILTTAVLATAAWGQSFEAASIKPVKTSIKDHKEMAVNPGRITYTNVSLQDCIQAAYGVRAHQISGPGWLDTERYEIVAKGAGGAAEPELMRMLQSLLAERFQLTLHRETKELSVYALTVAKGGPKLQEGDPKSPRSVNFGVPPGAFSFHNYPMAALAEQLSSRLFQLERPVVDQTGLSGAYNFTLRLAESNGELKRSLAGGPEAAPIFAVLQEQAGLRLAAQKGPVEMLVIDHVEKTPTEN